MELTEFVSNQRKLLASEKVAEDQQINDLLERASLSQLCAVGCAVAKLRIENTKTGLYGRFLVTFCGKSSADGAILPSHKLSTGDIVTVAPNSSYKQICCSGILTKVSEKTISIAIDVDQESRAEVNEELSVTSQRLYCLVKQSNTVTYQRLNSCLNDLEGYSNFPGRTLVEVFFGLSDLPLADKLADSSASGRVLYDKSLNEPQSKAAEFALSRLFSIIHGPPGTGKTTVVVEIVRQAINAGQKILVCAPSNVAVDNIVERLSKHMKPGSLIRLGHPARLSAGIHSYALDHVMKSSDEWSIVRDVRNDIDKSLATLRSKNLCAAERRNKMSDLRTFRKELQTREDSCLKQTLTGARVVASTLTTAVQGGPLKFSNSAKTGFDLVIIDECAQALEVACWIALLQCKRCVLVGDHLQLPPTIISNESDVKRGLSVTLMERLLSKFADQRDELVALLSIQYRMNSNIMSWSSKTLYEEKLQADESVRVHLLKDLVGVEETEETVTPLWLIDTESCDMHELDLPSDESKGNIYEAKLVLVHLESLFVAGVKEEDIAVISPYNLQVTILRRVLSCFPDVSVRSVDGFQGQEREVVILSLVRSNTKRDVGFLSEIRRLNVAVTRARRHLAIICDSSTVSSLPFCKDLCQHMRECGVVKSAHEYDVCLENLTCAVDISDLIENVPPATTSDQDSLKKSPNHCSNKPKQPSSSVTKDKRSTTVEDITHALPALLSNEKDNEIISRITSFCVAEDDNRLKEIKCQMEKFVESHEEQLCFPTSLTSYLRRFVHEMAETLDLVHVSLGEGPNRYICITKKPLRTVTPTAFNPEEKHEDVTILATNQSENKIIQEPKDLQKVPNSKTKTKKAKAPKQTSAKIQDGDDFDSLIKEFVQETTHCGQQNCKESVNLTGQKCKFCAAMFCLKHSLPEIHGCGAAAKAAARSAVGKETAGIERPVVRGSMATVEHRASLEAKLSKKVTELQTKRTNARKLK